jgi:hypothetical protein
MICAHVPKCPACASALQLGPQAQGRRGISKYSDLPWTTHYRSDDALGSEPSGIDASVVFSVDHVRVSRSTAELEVTGKRFHRMSLQQVIQYHEKRHPYDRHLYESLRSGVPYKPVFDLDRAIDERSPSLAVLQAAYVEVFVPFLVEFFNDVLGTAVTMEQVASLDASLEHKKFSKHITLHVQNPQDASVYAYNSRQDEMSVMASFRQAVEAQAEICERMGSFYYFISKGSVCTIVDYAIYHHGKRDMRMVGSCKAKGKSISKPLRTLMPDTDLAMHTPLCAFVCNVFGAKITPVVGPGNIPSRITTKRKRPVSHTASTPAAGVMDADATRAFGPLIPALIRIGEEAGGCQVQEGGVRCREDWGGGMQVVVPVYFQADSSCPCVCRVGNCVCRRCLFGVPHSRHWAEIRCVPTECKQMPARVTYYCHGCAHSTALFTSGTAAVSAVVAAHTSSSEQTPGGGGIAYSTICSRYIDPIRITPDDTGKGTLILKSGMGSGKTTQIRQYIESLPADASVLCIGYRRVLNSALASSFGLVDYQQATRAELPQCRRVCVQVDSLPRLLAEGGQQSDRVLRHAFDVVIVDESESTIDHFSSSTLAKKVLLCWKVFSLLLHNAKTLIMADADAGSRTLAVVRGLRVASSAAPPQLIENLDPDSGLQMCSCFVWMPSLDAFLEKALDILCKMNEPIYLATNSKIFAHAFMSIVLAHASRYASAGGEGGLVRTDVLLIDRDVPESTKRRVKDCNDIWIHYKLVICTPTVGAGIDFSVPNYFHSTFVYATDRSTTPREINQQRGRVRFPKDKRCYMLIDTHHKAATTETESVALRALERAGGAVIDDLTECHTTGSAEWMGIRLSKTPALLMRLSAIHVVEINESQNNMRMVLYRQMRLKFPRATHVIMSGPLTGPADERAHAVGMEFRRAQAADLVRQPSLDADEERMLTNAVITGNDEDCPHAKKQLHMQMLRNFYPGRAALAASDVMTIGHSTYLARVEFASNLLTPLADIRRAVSSASEWTPITVSGAVHFSLAHRASLESAEPGHVTKEFFAMFAFYTGIDNQHYHISSPDRSDAICRAFFDSRTTFHSSLAERRVQTHPVGFLVLQRKFGDIVGTPKQTRRRVRESFRRHVQTDMGIHLRYGGDHKHFAQGGESLGTSTTDCCSLAFIDHSDAIGLLDCVRAHVPETVSGVRAGQCVLQFIGESIRADGPAVCEVSGVGLGNPPVKTRKEIVQHAAPPSAMEAPPIEVATATAIAKLRAIRAALS